MKGRRGSQNVPQRVGLASITPLIPHTSLPLAFAHSAVSFPHLLPQFLHLWLHPAAAAGFAHFLPESCRCLATRLQIQIHENQSCQNCRGFLEHFFSWCCIPLEIALHCRHNTQINNRQGHPSSHLFTDKEDFEGISLCYPSTRPQGAPHTSLYKELAQKLIRFTDKFPDRGTRKAR